MKGKICLITGANSGIGKATTRGLAKKGPKIVMVCRNESRGKAAREEIMRESGNSNIDLMIADLSSQQSIRKLAEDFVAQYDRLDILINSAGAIYSDLQYSEDGIEMQFATNHLGYFLLSHLLLDVLKDSIPSRIINVASNAHFKGKIDFEDLYGEKRYSGLRAYAQSKLANVLFTYELSRKLVDSSVMVNCLHPGSVRTPLGLKCNSWLYKIGWTAAMPFLISPEKGAKTSIYLASSPDLEGITGKYFDNCEEIRSSALSYDEAIAKKLWDKSEKLIAS